jgi:hypothetical protein
MRSAFTAQFESPPPLPPPVPSPPPPPAGDSEMLTPALLDIIDSSDVIDAPALPAASEGEDYDTLIDAALGSALDDYKAAKVTLEFKWKGEAPVFGAGYTADNWHDGDLTLTQCKYLLFLLVRAKALKEPKAPKATWKWETSYWNKFAKLCKSMMWDSVNMGTLFNLAGDHPNPNGPEGKRYADIQTACNLILIAWITFCSDGSTKNFGLPHTWNVTGFNKLGPLKL